MLSKTEAVFAEGTENEDNRHIMPGPLR